MKQRTREIIKEILISLTYPAITSLGALSFLMLTAEPGTHSAFVANMCLILGLASLIGTIFFAVLDWDLYHDFHPVVNFFADICSDRGPPSFLSAVLCPVDVYLELAFWLEI